MRGVQQVGTPLAPHVALGAHRVATPERGQLPHRQQVIGLAEADLPGDIGMQRLAGLGQVGQPRAERVDPQPAALVDLGALVGVEQVAQPVLLRRVHSGRQHVDEAVDQIQVARLVADIGQLTGPHDPEAAARLPGDPHPQPEVRPNLLEHQRGAQHVLEQGPSGPVARLRCRGERLPQDRLVPLAADPHDAQATRAAGALADLVVGVVGEQRRVGSHPSCRQPAGAGHEAPRIPRSDHRHEERGQPVVVGYLEEAATAEIDVPLRSLRRLGIPGRVMGVGAGTGHTDLLRAWEHPAHSMWRALSHHNVTS